jgi:hypothetical protein
MNLDTHRPGEWGRLRLWATTTLQHSRLFVDRIVFEHDDASTREASYGKYSTSTYSALDA